MSREGVGFELRPYYIGVAEDLLRAATESREELSEWMSWMHPGYAMGDVESWVEIAIAAWDAGTA
ncbi:MAG: GNAT family N-acetyltransferase, partial [Verrucomicrobiales bacterium]